MDTLRTRIRALEYLPGRSLQTHDHNWRHHPQFQQDALAGVLREVGISGALLVYHSQRQGGLVILDGHLRQATAPDQTWPCLVLDVDDAEADYLLATYDPLTTLAEAGVEELTRLLRTVQSGEASVQALLSDLAVREGLALGSLGGEVGALEDVEPELDRAEELREKYGVEIAQLWSLGKHRLICGDCTDKAVVERLMAGQLATLCHADPPYGMGKEAEGIANDNLYASKLDAFQMRWWEVARGVLEANASVYIWGNAEDLWRLWYVGGLKDSERLTLRNEVVWDKGDSGAGVVSLQGSEGLRKYPPGSERCLFFMRGEQGFSTNADNYWDGWEPIRSYLKAERDKMGWDNATCKELAGHSPTSGCHWFDNSQWMMPTQDVYEAWQRAARGDGFKRDYDDLKRDYYATRAYFDNTHDNMTDVWAYARVHGEDRWDHPTPKPLSLLQRILKSSSQAGDIVYDPFLGSGTTLVACETLGQVCYACDISPAYVAVALERWAQLSGQTPERIA